MTGFLTPRSPELDIAQLRRDVEALKRRSFPPATGGDYVLLQTNRINGDGQGVVADGQGIVVGLDDDPLEFGDVIPISQDYLHLVLEASVRSSNNQADLTDGHDDFNMLLGTVGSEENGEHAWREVLSPDSTDDPTVPVDAGGGSYGADQFQILRCIPGFDADFGAGGPWYTHVTIKFPFYSRTDRSHAAYWQAAGLVPGGAEDAEFVPFYSAGSGIWPLDIAEAALGNITMLGQQTGFGPGSMAALYGIRGGELLTAPDIAPPSPFAFATVTINGDVSDPLPMTDADIWRLILGDPFGGTINRRYDDVLVGSTPGGSDFFSDDFNGATLVPPWTSNSSGVLDSGNYLLTSFGELYRDLTTTLPLYLRFQFRLDSSDTASGFFAQMPSTGVSYVAVGQTGGSWYAETDAGNSTFGSVVTDTWVQVDIAIEAA